VVADAVAVEPVSIAKFPANREKNREFCKIAASGAPETLNSAAVAGLPMQIPYSTKQGIILAEQGILAQEQGIFSDKTENITNEVFGTHN
jgi:hypothetical protein